MKLDWEILYQDNIENVTYNTETNKNISKAEIVDLINKWILSLSNDDEDINKIDIPSDYDLTRANQTLLDILIIKLLKIIYILVIYLFFNLFHLNHY